MKRIFFYSIITMGLTLSACKKQLDIANPNVPTIDNFWLTADDAVAGVNAVYSTLHRGAISRWMPMIYIARSDEGLSTSPDLGMQNFIDKFVQPDYNQGHVRDTYADNYIGIFRANQVLDKVPNIEMDATVKNRVLGEAKFLRGLFYFNLATLFGNVPLMLKTSSPQDYPPTSTQSQVYDQVAKDLAEAAALLPNSYPNVASDLGRATKGAANALLAKTLMQQKKFTEALVPLNWLAEGEGRTIYNLTADYRDNFIVSRENNVESVFEWQWEINPTETHDNDIQDPNQNYGSSAAQFIAPKPVGYQDIQGRRWVINEFHQEKTAIGARDPRLAASFIYDSTDIGGPLLTRVYGTTWANRYGMSNSDAFFRKFLNDHWKNDEGFRSRNNWRYIRYADVLLMYAEALNEAGQTAQAYQYVDRVRQRAGLTSLTVARPGLSKEQFRSQIKHERITELTGEGWRWHDLARWGELSPTLSSRDAGFANFVVGKNEFLPIPQIDVDINPNLIQNPGF